MVDGIQIMPNTMDHPLPKLNKIVSTNSNGETKSTTNIFDSDDWRGKEIPMFDIDIERNGVMRIWEALSEEEKKELPDVNMPLRHFRAEKGDIQKAIKKIKAAILWRKNFQVNIITSCMGDGGDPAMRRLIEFENETGKIYVRGYDKDCRAIIYLCPGLENTKPSEDHIKHLVYQLERAIACTKRKSSLSKYVIIVNFKDYRLFGAIPPLSITKMVVDIMANQYPERMMRFYICNPPTVFRGLYSMMKPFIDPVTKEKIKFIVGAQGVDVMEQYFDLSTLDKSTYGTSDLKPFNSKEYLTTPFDHT